jgi:hypothetical protein
MLTQHAMENIIIPTTGTPRHERKDNIKVDLTNKKIGLRAGLNTFESQNTI